MADTPNVSAQLEWQASLLFAVLRESQTQTRLLRDISQKGGGNENVTKLAEGLLDTVVPGAGALAGAFVSNGPTPVILIVIAVELGLILYRLGIPEQIVELITKNPFNPTSWALNYVNDHMKDKECSLTLAELINDYVNGPSIGGKLDHLNWAISGAPQDLPRDAIFSNVFSSATDLVAGFLDAVGLKEQSDQAEQIKDIINKIISAPDYRSGSLLTQLAGSVKELGAWEKGTVNDTHPTSGHPIVREETDAEYNARMQGRYETFNSLMRQLLVAMGTRDKDLPGKPTVPTIEKSYLDDIFAQLSAEQTVSGSPITFNSTLRDIIKALQINFPPELIENNRLKTAPNLDLGRLETKVEATNTALGTIDSRLHSDILYGGDQNVAESLKSIAYSTSSSSSTLSAFYSDTDTALDTLNTRAAVTNNSLDTLNAKVAATNTALGTIDSRLHSSEVNNADQTASHILKLLAAGLGDVKTSVGATNTALGTIDSRLHSDLVAFGDLSVAHTLKCILNDIQIDNESVFRAIRNLLAGVSTEATLASIKGTADSIKGTAESIAGTIGHGNLGDITVYERLRSLDSIKSDTTAVAGGMGQAVAKLGNINQVVDAIVANMTTLATETTLSTINTKLGGEDPTLFNVVYEMNQKIGEGDACCDEEWDTDGNVVRPDLIDKLTVNATTDGDIRCKRVGMLLDFYKKWMQDFCNQADFTSTMLGFLKDGMLTGSLRGSALGTIKLWAPKVGGLSLLKDPASVAIRYGLGAQITACLPHIIVTLAIVSVTAGKIVHCACVEDFPAMLGLTGSGNFSSLKCTLYNALVAGKTGAEFKALFDEWIDSVVFQGDLTFGFAPATRKAILKAFFPLQAATAFVEGKLINFSAAELLDPNGNPYPGDCGGCGGGTTPRQGVGHVVSLTSFGGFFGNTAWYFWEVPTDIPGRTNKRGSASANDANGLPRYIVIAPFPTGDRRMRIVASDRANSTLPLPNKTIVVEWNNGGGYFTILPGANQGNWITIGPTTSNTPGIIKAAGATNFNIQAGSGTTGLDPTLPPSDFGVEFDPPL